MVEIVFFKGKHLGLILFPLIPPFEVLLLVTNVLDILVLNIALGSLLLYDLVDLACVKVNLG